MRPDYKKWADYVISGKTPTEATLLVYPGIVKKTAQNKQGVIGKDSGVQEYIREQRAKIDAKTSDKLTTELSDQETGILLSSAKKRSILSQIVSGTYDIEELVLVKGIYKKIKRKPNISEIMKAIELDNKMSGDNVLAKPAQFKKAEEATKVIIMEDQTEAPLNPNGDY